MQQVLSPLTKMMCFKGKSADIAALDGTGYKGAITWMILHHHPAEED